ncbi:MAG TPA: DUF1707 domain-containing protein [Baekduia sp.]|nr:DUF1707 domain-containing protein [Baekduia sp.]
MCRHRAPHSNRHGAVHAAARPARRGADVRAGDTERTAVQERLAAHFAAGRLTADELEERTAAAGAARTRGELHALEADLPRLPRPPRPPRSRRERLAAAAWCHAPWAVPVGLVVLL